MGYASGINAQGRLIGYGISAICDEPHCQTRIDRGLAYVCGDEHDGGEYGCGGYFCARHLFISNQRVFLCLRCLGVLSV